MGTNMNRYLVSFRADEFWVEGEGPNFVARNVFDNLKHRVGDTIFVDMPDTTKTVLRKNWLGREHLVTLTVHHRLRYRILLGATGVPKLDIGEEHIDTYDPEETWDYGF